MSDLIRDMDPYLRIFLVVTTGVFLKTLLLHQWERFKVQEARKPVTMRNVRGVYRPWGIVERIQRVFNIIVALWAVWIAAMIILLAWHKLISPII